MRRIRHQIRDEGGYTITEMMVVMLVLSLITATFYAFLFGGDRAAKDGRDWLELNQTARLAFERLTRELREAEDILAVHENDIIGPQGEWGIQFVADFNANGTFSGGAYNPVYDDDETITYEYEPSSGSLLISTKADPTPTALVDHITSFKLSYFGSDPRLDVGCVGTGGWGAGEVPGCVSGDGIVMWQEVDRSWHEGISGFGNGNRVFDIVEWRNISSIVVEMTVALRHERHKYRTGVELRNLFK